MDELFKLSLSQINRMYVDKRVMECRSPSTSVFFICVHSRSSVVEYLFSPILRQLLRARLDLEKQSGKRISTPENFKARPEATKRIAWKKSSATFT